MKKSNGKPSPNDQRSNVKNPNSPQHQKANDNKSVQIQQNNSKKGK